MENAVILTARDRLAESYKVSPAELRDILFETAVLELVAVTDFKGGPKTLQAALASKTQQLGEVTRVLHSQLDESAELIRRHRTMLDILTHLAIRLDECVRGQMARVEGKKQS